MILLDAFPEQGLREASNHGTFRLLQRSTLAANLFRRSEKTRDRLVASRQLLEDPLISNINPNQGFFYS